MKLKLLPSKLIILTFILMSIATANTFSQQVKKISIQGFLKDGTGKAVADAEALNITFKLYTTETGGTAAWTGTLPVKVIGGVYSAYLGAANNPIDNLNWGTSSYFVGITVGTGTEELTPRTELTFAPYSLGSPLADRARLADLATLATKATTVVCSGAVGDVKYSILNPTQFALENGTCWVPMDGSSMAGSKLATIIGGSTVPNAGGLFLRGQESANGTTDNDPDRTFSSTIATLQGDNFKSHNHNGSTTSNGAHSHPHTDTVPNVYPWDVENKSTSNGVSTYLSQASGTNITRATDAVVDHQHYITLDGGSETRPKNLNLWTYIRIN